MNGNNWQQWRYRGRKTRVLATSLLSLDVGTNIQPLVGYHKKRLAQPVLERPEPVS